jgi:DMSO/TMAO reductase YedYZ molybdopterin-dependent catalytic subunit
MIRFFPVAHGAPVRFRVEWQLGYKRAKYVMRIELVENLESIVGGRGGYWKTKGMSGMQESKEVSDS